MRQRTGGVCLSAAAAAALATCGRVSAQPSYRFTVDRPRSEARLGVETRTTLDGAWIGNYDPKSNPTGTQTRPGLFGGSGNQPIPVAADLAAAGTPSSHPAGSFEMDADVGTGAVVVRFLTLDMVAGQPLGIDFTLTLAFATFRTFSPNSLFLGVPGGLPLPLGGAEITALAAEQTTAGIGVLTPSGPGAYTFTALVPMSISGEVTALGQVFALPGTVLPVPIRGALTLGPPARVTVEFDAGFQQPLPPPPFSLENVPLDLPTILPPGGTAHLLLTAAFGEVEIGATLGLTLVAAGEAFCRPDLDGDGFLTIFDFLVFQNYFAAADPRADYDNDGRLDVMDFLAYQVSFARGCE